MYPLHTRLLQDGWHVDALDTGRTADYLMPEAKAVILAINALRSDPAAVDDGVATRGHRTNLFNPYCTRCGVATAYIEG